MNILLQRLESRKNAMRVQEICSQDEIKILLNWFDTYDIQVAEHNRCARMGIACDHNIIELDVEAEVKRIRIKQIRNEVK